MNRVDRLLAILAVLESRQLITVDQLAERFHISTAKVYSDIKALEGLNIFVRTRNDSGCLEVRGRFVPVVIFSEQEAEALEKLRIEQVVGKEGARDEDGNPLDSALKKIRTALRDHRNAKKSRYLSKNKLIIPASIKAPLFGNGDDRR